MAGGRDSQIDHRGNLQPDHPVALHFFFAQHAAATDVSDERSQVGVQKGPDGGAGWGDTTAPERLHRGVRIALATTVRHMTSKDTVL